jgi:uncharacterized PurR-regulated membrane protein YhhQ (DUF165 family)
MPPLRYYDILTVLATTVAVCTNMLVLKVTRIGPFTFGAAVVFFPITYVLGDVLTEVYGFRRARRVADQRDVGHPARRDDRP